MQGRDRHRPHASDPRAPERDRPPDRRRRDLRRRAPPRAGRTCARCSGSNAPSCTRARLAFTHPGDGRRVEFDSPLPPDLASGARRHLAKQEEAIHVRSGTPVQPSGSSTARSSTSTATRSGCRTAATVTVDVVRHPKSVVSDPGARARAGHPDPAIPLRGQRSGCGSCRPAASTRGRRRKQAARRECHEEIGQGAGHGRPAGRDVPDARLLRRGDGVLPRVGARGADRRGRSRTKTRTSRPGSSTLARRARWCAAARSST